MNRADKIRAYALHAAAAAALKTELEREARGEFEREGVRPTWNLPAARVSVSTTHDRAIVSDQEAFFDFLERQYPTEVQRKVVREVRSQEWLKKLLEAWAALGPVEPPEDTDRAPGVQTPDGTVVPGLEWRRGNEYVSTSITVDAAVKRELAALAAAYAAGTAELPNLTSG